MVNRCRFSKTMFIFLVMPSNAVFNAESPQHGSRPCPGRISHWQGAEGTGVWLDTHCYSGYLVPPFYDSLLSKLIVHGGNRAEAAACMKEALASFRKFKASTLESHFSRRSSMMTIT